MGCTASATRSPDEMTSRQSSFEGAGCLWRADSSPSTTSKLEFFSLGTKGTTPTTLAVKRGERGGKEGVRRGERDETAKSFYGVLPTATTHAKGKGKGIAKGKAKGKKSKSEAKTEDGGEDDAPLTLSPPSSPRASSVLSVISEPTLAEALTWRNSAAKDSPLSPPPSPSPSPPPPPQTLAPCHTIALTHASNLASRASMKASTSLYSRAKVLGLTRGDVQECASYLKNIAPILIHVTDETLRLLSLDSHYKCSHELNGSDKHRNRVENALYANSYHDALASDKIKYGCLNVMSCPSGVVPAQCYGTCYLELQPEVRKRATLHFGDSFSPSLCPVATLDSSLHLLNVMPDGELLSVALVAKGGTALCQPAAFVEVHYHGQILLDRDVKAIRVPLHVKENALNELAFAKFRERGISILAF